jgi:hypothetical protein
MDVTWTRRRVEQLVALREQEPRPLRSATIELREERRYRRDGRAAVESIFRPRIRDR